MNSNNKFGKCCNCPAFMDDSRLFTNWETSKTYNYKLGLKLNADTNTKYKKIDNCINISFILSLIIFTVVFLKLFCII